MDILQTSSYTIEYQFSPNPSAPTLVFLHGLGANLNQFTNQHLFFKDHFQVLSMNVLGHGKSRSSAPFSLSSCALSVIALLDSLNIDQFHFIGNSMGGNIGYELLRSYEDRLLSMTTFGTTAELRTSKTITTILILTYKILPISLIAQLASTSGQTQLSKQTIKTMMRQTDKNILLDIVPSLANFNYLSLITQSQTPFLIIKGAKDSDINKALSSTLVRFKERGHFTLLELDNVGHFANLDSPEKFNIILFDFLSSLNA